MYPYFRVTECVENFDGALQLWLEHFKVLGIPACVARTEGIINPQGRYAGRGYAVWRQGEETAAIGREPNSEKLDGEIIESVNGFQHIVI